MRSAEPLSYLVFDAGERLAEGEGFLPRTRRSWRRSPSLAADAVARAQLERFGDGGTLQKQGKGASTNAVRRQARNSSSGLTRDMHGTFSQINSGQIVIWISLWETEIVNTPACADDVWET